MQMQKGTPHKPETKQKISDGVKSLWAKIPEEDRKKRARKAAETRKIKV